MKKTKLGLLCLLAVATWSTVHAQGTAFTYQGQLNEGANQANGTYDLKLTIFGTSSGGSAIAGPLTNAATAASNGLFTITLDFGAGVFTGEERWLEIAVRTNSGGAFTTLAPRQKISAAPYAITAGTVTGSLPGTALSGLYTGAVTLNNPANVFNGALFAGTFTGNGGGLTTLNSAQLTGTVPVSALGNAWKTSGNTGTNPTNGVFLGTADNQPFEFKVNGERVMRFEPHPYAPNIIGGFSNNAVASGVYGAVISGGGTGGLINTVGGNWASILGGYANAANGQNSIAGGFGNVANGFAAFTTGNANEANGGDSVALGFRNDANGPVSIAIGNTVRSEGHSSVALGAFTIASGDNSTAMGLGSTASGESSFAAGNSAQATNQGTFVWADSSTNTFFTSTGSNQFLIRATGGVGIGTPNPQTPLHLYSANNPTTVRIQSTGTPGFGRVEFVSNPQGDANEWRPGYIQSADNGGFTGGLSFVVNGTGAGNKFAELETMRIVNGRVGIGTTTPVSALQVVGTVTATAFNPPSDRNLKENFTPVSPREVLDKVTSLPISRWNFKGDTATPHVGPMAQDFHAAFGLGTDERHIATVDADGVALAAIQGLNEKVEVRSEKLEVRSQKSERRIQKLEAENAQLKLELENLRRLVDNLTDANP